jgi:hypothetical protein
MSSISLRPASREASYTVPDRRGHRPEINVVNGPGGRIGSPIVADVGLLFTMSPSMFPASRNDATGQVSTWLAPGLIGIGPGALICAPMRSRVQCRMGRGGVLARHFDLATRKKRSAGCRPRPLDFTMFDIAPNELTASLQMCLSQCLFRTPAFL